MYEERVPPVERPGPTVVVRSLFLGTRRGGDGCLSRSLWLLQRATISQLLLFIIIAVATRYYYCSWSLLVHNIGIIYYFFLLILLLLLSLHLLRYTTTTCGGWWWPIILTSARSGMCAAFSYACDPYYVRDPGMSWWRMATVGQTTQFPDRFICAIQHLHGKLSIFDLRFVLLHFNHWPIKNKLPI